MNARILKNHCKKSNADTFSNVAFETVVARKKHPQYNIGFHVKTIKNK